MEPTIVTICRHRNALRREEASITYTFFAEWYHTNTTIASRFYVDSFLTRCYVTGLIYL